jgi:hypothetical protein
MTRKLRLLPLAAFACAMAHPGLSLADDITIDPVPFTSSADRAQVRAELDAYKKSRVNPWSIAYDPLRGFRSSRTRAEVTAEYIAHRDAVAAMTGEDSGSQYLAQLRGGVLPPSYLAEGRDRRAR